MIAHFYFLFILLKEALYHILNRHNAGCFLRGDGEKMALMPLMA
jgi:hypothetical protein